MQDSSGMQVNTDSGSDYLITVQIEDSYAGKLDADSLHRLALGVLHEEDVPGPMEMGVLITTDDEVHALNLQYLGHDYQTDVISFSMADEEGGAPFVMPEERPAYLGDVVISYDRAVEQAPDYGHSTEAEVYTLLIHGMLHLLGYDDREDLPREKMHARQDDLLRIIGSGF